MARVDSTQKLNTTVERKEVLIDGGWNFFKTVMVFLGGAAVIAWVLWLGYHWGSSGCYTCTQNTPAAVVVNPPVSLTQAETAAAIAALEKARLAIEEMKGQKTTGVPAPDPAAVVVPPPPKAERQVPPATKAGPPCPCPPPSPVDKAQPMPTLSSAERRRNEMWSALRR